jgi:hypothetical protein
MDATVSKMLFLHIPSRHPNSFPELELSSIVQSAALAGVGLLYQGSCHRLMAEIMLDEMARRPGSGDAQDGIKSGAAGRLFQVGISAMFTVKKAQAWYFRII